MKSSFRSFQGLIHSPLIFGYSPISKPLKLISPFVAWFSSHPAIKEQKGTGTNISTLYKLKMDQAWKEGSNLDVLYGLYSECAKQTQPSLDIYKTLITYSKSAGKMDRCLSFWKDICRFNIVLDDDCFYWLLRTSSTHDIGITKQLFEKMKHGTYKVTVGICDCLITAFNRQRMFNDLLEVGRFVIQHHIHFSHSIPYTHLFKACRLTNNLDLGKQLHQVIKGFKLIGGRLCFQTRSYQTAFYNQL